MADVEIIETGDGSLSGRHLGSGATYRSLSGALSEVRHVFIESNGLRPAAQTHLTWTVVELGFGLGTSFCETASLADELGLELRYISVERDPVKAESLPPGRGRWGEVAADAIASIAESDSARVERANTTLEIRRCEWRDLELPDRSADALYFDPFGPRVNPESWRQPDFELARRILRPEGRLATFSAAGHVRRAMAAAGLFLATRPGPGRKREITVASPTDAGLGEFERLSMSRYLREDR